MPAAYRCENVIYLQGNVTVQDYEKCSVRISTVANEVNTYVYSGLPDDEYTFYARSIDQGGNISPNISYIFTVGELLVLCFLFLRRKPVSA